MNLRMRLHPTTVVIILGLGLIVTIQCEADNSSTGFFAKVVPESIKNIFTKKDAGNATDQYIQESEKNNTESENNNYQKQDNNATTKEHGNLDFFGRDIIRTVSKTASKVGRKIGFISSNTSSGLDANKTFFSGVVNNFKEHIRAIYPGTLWCGDGTKAKNYEELGHFNDTDACCRDHDECPDNIDADGKKYGLENTGLFTRSHCDCDSKFYDCLKEADSVISKKIGFTYFTILGPQCYKKDFPIIGCSDIKSGKCVQYEFDKSQKKQFQWFDSPAF